jgi:type I restriction enzyme S subunit
MSGELPIGWAECFIREVVVGRKGKKPKLFPQKPSSRAYPYILIEQMEGNPPRHFTQDASVPIAEPDEVLVVWDGSVGKCARGLCGVIGSTIVALKPIGIESGYLEAFLRYIRPVLQETSRGSGLQHINPEVFWHLTFPLAPIQEQRRIVAKFEKLLGKVNGCQQRLLKILTLLKCFRQSTLIAACSGLLTEDWRRKHSDVQPPAVEEDSDGSPYALPYSWKQVRLGALTSLVTSGSRGWAKYYADAGSIFIRAQDINGDALNLDNVAHVLLPKRVEGKRTRVQQYDILVTITGANVAKSALVNQILKDAYINQHVALIRLLDTHLSQFLYLWIVSPVHGRKQLLDAAYGEGKPGLNLDNIRGLFVSVPPFKEQQEIVRRVEAMFKLAEAVEKRVTAAAMRAEKLTQSILAKAFRGELVPTEAEIAHREGRSYEPASDLLARIKSERE